MDSEYMKAAREISNRLQWLEAEYHAAALDAYLVLLMFDPELARLSVDALGDSNNAAAWFAERTGVLSGKRPWELMATGDVAQIRSLLRAARLGVPP